MPESAITGLYRVVLEWTDGVGYDHQPVNVFHVRDNLFSNEIAQAVADDWAAAILASWDLNLKARYNDIFPAIVTAYPLNTDGAPRQASVGAAGGTNANESLPAEVSLCASVHTDLRSRRARGRSYLPAPANDQSSINAVPVTSLVNAALAHYESLRAGAEFQGQPWGIYSRKFDEFNEVVSITVNQTWDTQRRRGLR